jgi:hypothetical protein
MKLVETKNNNFHRRKVVKPTTFSSFFERCMRILFKRQSLAGVVQKLHNILL